jgi:KUP system potassium uptake protein
VRRFGKWLAIPAIIGATTLLADGIITPPISVASAVEGLTAIHGMENIPTVPIVIVILSTLFFFQRFGTHRVGSVFGPVMLVWFIMLLALGVYWIVQSPFVLKAFNPTYAFHLLVHYPAGFWILGAVFLATTGAEALYSDLGHCGRKNVRITWIFVKVALIANYLGQSAWVLNSGMPILEGKNPFFEVMPDGFLLVGIAIATMATIIASQALISGSYTLISEAINMNFWPRVAVRQPSNVKGQIYIPSVNTILWIGCVLMIVYFKSSTHMEAAYGFSITIAMMMTSLLLTFFLIYRMKWDPAIVTLILVVFFVVEGSFFVANVAKIKERWMFLFFELFIFLTMYVWYFARKMNQRHTRMLDLGQHVAQIQELAQDESIPKFCTHLVFLTKSKNRGEVEEKIIRSIFARKPKRADVYWFVHINHTEHPYTLNYEVDELVDDKIIKVVLHVGFRVQPKVELCFKQLLNELVSNQELNLHRYPNGASKYNQEPDFKFIVQKKFLSVENVLSVKESVFLHGYFSLRKMAQSDEKAFGLDKNDVIVEHVPLVYAPHPELHLTRIK